MALAAACALAVSLATAALLGAAVPGWALGLAAALLAGVLGVGVGLHRVGVFARPVVAASPSLAAGRLALTFDDGPHPEHTRRVLDLLEARGHRGTFFVIGARGDAHPDLLAEIARRGHGLGNHSYAHSHLTPMLPRHRLRDDLVRAAATIERATGARPRWFRPPMGLVTPPVAAAARLAGLELVGWTRSARDGTARQTVAGALARLRDRLRPGAILVLHDGSEDPGRVPIVSGVLPPLLDQLDALGLRSVPLDELLGGRRG